MIAPAPRVARKREGCADRASSGVALPPVRDDLPRRRELLVLARTVRLAGRVGEYRAARVVVLD